MKKLVKQVKKGLAALLAVAMVMGVASLVPVMAQAFEGYPLHDLEEFGENFHNPPDWIVMTLDNEPEVEEELIDIWYDDDGNERRVINRKHIIPVGTTLDVDFLIQDALVTIAVFKTPEPVDFYAWELLENFDPLLILSDRSEPNEGTLVFDSPGTFYVTMMCNAPDGGASAMVQITVVGESAVLPQQTQTQATTSTTDTISVTVNGSAVNFTDQQPTIIDGRTLVPVRGVFEGLGFNVSWNEQARQATLARANDTIVITIDSATFIANGASYTLDVPAQVIGGSTMLPIRAVLESVGYKLDWNGDTSTVVITTN